MRLRILSSLIVIFIAVLAVMAWNKNTTRNAPASETPGEAAAPPSGSAMPPDMEPAAPAQDPGVAWERPGRWVEELASGMRLAAYAVPPPASGGEGAKCAVYYFGRGQGGGTKANLERWIGEFQNPGTPKRRSYEVRGLKVSQVEVAGTFTDHAAPAGGTSGETSGWTLLGAIVEGPNGALFFKLTGPTPTVAPAAKEFDRMVASLRKK